MTGSDAEIVCGEWQTGDYPQSESGELYNILLNIKQIVRHPQYNVMVRLSAFLQYDIAAFKVDETQLSPVRLIWTFDTTPHIQNISYGQVSASRSHQVIIPLFSLFQCFNIFTYRSASQTNAIQHDKLFASRT